MTTPHRHARFDTRQIHENVRCANAEKPRQIAPAAARGAGRSVGISAKFLACAVALALVPAIRGGAQSAPEWHLPDIPWAFPVRDKVQPVLDERSGPLRVPGSSKSYTQEQIDDLANPPDWFPDEHAPMPKVVAHGNGGSSLGCASCHLGSGLGHPESANLAGVSAEYIERQLADFKAGRRMGEAMNDMTKDLSDEDARYAAEWFASLQPKVWNSVVETDRVPKTFINIHLMRMPLPGGGDEPIGNRIIELPRDISGAESRDPHSGFIAYVPKGSLAKGKELVTTGGGGKTIQCAICHGPSLNGLGEVPPIAGHSPLYLFRQLYYFKDGSRHGSMGALMKGVVAKMTQDDMVAVAAYVGSLKPGAEESFSNAATRELSAGVVVQSGDKTGR
ncbi:MAG TPA: c-type cytochrome [Candidatus Acidoferrales bacterium]|nr:c-type cytochrome [Candidatus Acidoferrales bacterium]